MTDYRPPRYVYPPPSSASMSTLPNTPPPPPPRGQAVLDAIARSDELTARRLLRDWHDTDPDAATRWRNTLTMALAMGALVETAP